ncbi:MAG: transposase, partial [Acidobacteriota bacterium]|nr:transposase [Acidobacteriota bacterium]
MVHMSQGENAEQIPKLVKVSPATVRAWMKRPEPPSKRTRKPTELSTKRALVRTRRAEMAESLLRTKVIRTARRSSPLGFSVKTALIVTMPVNSPTKVARYINQDKKLLHNIGRAKVSAATIRRDLKGAAMKPYMKRNGPRFTERHLRLRVEFARGLLYPVRPLPFLLEEIAFTDEKWFDSDDGREVYWARKGDDIPHRRRDQHGHKIMVWAAVGFNFRRIVRIPRDSTTNSAAIKINEASYVKVIDVHAKAVRDAHLVFQQDGAAGHKKAERNGWFENRGIRVLKNWPPNSPDLSPIETLWAVIAR